MFELSQLLFEINKETLRVDFLWYIGGQYTWLAPVCCGQVLVNDLELCTDDVNISQKQTAVETQLYNQNTKPIVNYPDSNKVTNCATSNSY